MMRVRSTAVRRRSLAVAALLGALALGGAAAHAQGPTGVRGTVVDSVSRQPIANVQVTVGSRGAMTDAAGRYLITGIASGTVTVRAQRIGFAAQERRVTVGADETAVVDFALRPSAAVLTEMVVVGYGSRSRAEVSSAVANVRAEEVQNVPVAGVDAALQGKAPGVQVVQNAGNPGNGITVRVRGSSSISASNQPLFVVDGVPIIRENLSQLDFGGQDITAVTGLSPDEIESIDVLKDAAAASIYGSRASNGVVMITTKRGRPGATRFSFNTYYGQQEVAHKLELLSGPQYVAYMAEAMGNDGYDSTYMHGFNVRPGVDDSVSTDWQAAVFRTAPIANLNLQVQGGGERFQYLLSGSRFDQSGIVRGSSYDRDNARLNLDFTATPKLTLRSSFGLAREHFNRMENDNTIEGSGANSLAVQPNIPVYTTDANGRQIFTSSDHDLAYSNPVALGRFNDAPSSTLRFTGSVEGAYDFTDRLRLNARLGADVYDLNERRWDSPRVADTYASGATGVGTQGTNTATKYLGETYATYDAVRAERQKLALTVGASLEYNRNEFTYLRGEGFSSDAFQYAGDAAKITLYDGNASQNNLVSFFTRANYSLRDRYLLTASIRTDGSSRFAEGKRFGVFPSISAGWNVTDEPALAGLKRIMETKLRASYGVTGNQAIPTNYGFLTAFSRAHYADVAGLAGTTLGNPDLKWETTRETDVGADFGFLGGRVTVIADWYHKNTTDLLLSRPIPCAATAGTCSYWDNIGAVRNQGVELGINTVNVQPRGPGGFGWRTDFNIAHNDNKITRLYNNEPFTAGIRNVTRMEVGQPISSFYTLKFTGVDTLTGEAMYEDIAGALDAAGNPIPDGAVTSADRQIVGSPHPKYFGGLRNQVEWRGFDLNTFVQFAQGQKVFNLFRLFSDDAGYNLDNKIANVLRRWQRPGDRTDVPRPSWDGASNAYDVSSRFIEDGSYVRLDEVTLGYALPARLASRIRLSDARLFVSGRNLKLWTDYLGYDPDVNSQGSDSNTALGIDFYAYPKARTISFGVSGTW